MIYNERNMFTIKAMEAVNIKKNILLLIADLYKKFFQVQRHKISTLYLITIKCKVCSSTVCKSNIAAIRE